MVKNRFILLIFSVLTSATSIGAKPIAALASLNSFYIEPLHLDGSDSGITFDVTANSANPIEISIKITNDYYPDGLELFRKSYKKNVTETYVYDNSYTRLSNIISISFTTKSFSNVTYDNEVQLSESSAIRLNNEDYNYESKSKTIYFSKKGGIKNLPEKLRFVNFSDIYVADYYHKLDLSDFYIIDNSEFTHDVSCGDILLEIKNLNGAFKNLNPVKDSLQIPLKLAKKGSRYFLTPNVLLYVNPTTLDMSSAKKEGYVPTNCIYFPRNGKRFENEYSCRIGIMDFGLDRNQIVTSFKYKSLHNIIGDCRNSEYCVINR